MKEGVKNADLAIEAASENEQIKTSIFKELDVACKPECILATNTSSISITKIAAATQRPDKVIGMHFMNPVPVMKLIEVIRGFKTSDEVNNTIFEISKKLNKIPVEVNDYPGFIANRILMPMINEAIYSLYEGVAGVAEIDTVMKLGMAHPMEIAVSRFYRPGCLSGYITCDARWLRQSEICTLPIAGEYGNRR